MLYYTVLSALPVVSHVVQLFLEPYAVSQVLADICSVVWYATIHKLLNICLSPHTHSHSCDQMVSRNFSQFTLPGNLPDEGFQDEKKEKEEEEEEWIDSPHVVDPSIHRPKDPRSRHKYNILFRLFFW